MIDPGCAKTTSLDSEHTLILSDMVGLSRYPHGAAGLQSVGMCGLVTGDEGEQGAYDGTLPGVAGSEG